MKIKKIDHVNFSVDSFEKSVDWYQRVFGFELVEKGIRSGLPWGILQAGEACIAIYERPESKRLDADRFKKQKLHSVNHFGFQIEDRRQFEEVIEREKVRVDHTWQYPHSFSWYVLDPSGYEIEISHWNENKVQFSKLD